MSLHEFTPGFSSAFRDTSPVSERWIGPQYTLYNIFRSEISRGYGPEDCAEVFAASEFALEKFHGSLRGSGIPKSMHSFDVVLLALGIDIPTALYPINSQSDVESLYASYESEKGKVRFPKIPVHVVVAGLLHDLVEEKRCTSEEIYERFGKRVGDIVNDVTYLKTGKGSQSDLHFEMAKTLATRPESFYLKACDIWSNVRTLQFLPDKVRDGVVIKWSAEFQGQKASEYWEYAPLLLELRHPYSEQICDELFKRLYPDKYFEMYSYIMPFRKIYDSAEQVLDLFNNRFSQYFPRSYDYDSRSESIGVYRAFDRSARYGLTGLKAIAPTLVFTPRTYRADRNLHTFIEHYSFDSSTYFPKERTRSAPIHDAFLSEYYIPMAEGHLLRLVVTSPEDRWLFTPMQEVCFGNDSSMLYMLKERYDQYFADFHQGEGMQRLIREAGRNLMRVKVISHESKLQRNVYLPRGASAFDLAVRLASNREEMEAIPDMELRSGKRMVSLPPHAELFPRQQIVVRETGTRIDPYYALHYHSRLPESRRILEQHAAEKYSRLRRHQLALAKRLYDIDKKFFSEYPSLVLVSDIQLVDMSYAAELDPEAASILADR